MANVKLTTTQKSPHGRSTKTKPVIKMDLNELIQYEIDLWITYKALRTDQTQDLARCLRLINRVQLRIKELKR